MRGILDRPVGHLKNYSSFCSACYAFKYLTPRRMQNTIAMQISSKSGALWRIPGQDCRLYRPPPKKLVKKPLAPQPVRSQPEVPSRKNVPSTAQATQVAAPRYHYQPIDGCMANEPQTRRPEVLASPSVPWQLLQECSRYPAPATQTE